MQSFRWIWAHLLKKFFMESFIFCAVYLVRAVSEIDDGENLQECILLERSLLKHLFW